MHGLIAVDAEVCPGQARIRGTRIPAHQLVKMLANGDTIEDLLEEHSSLERRRIKAALEYAAAR